MMVKTIAALTIATAASLPLATLANACGGGGDVPASTEFVTPSGNIACTIYADGAGANCEIQHHDWAIPASTEGPFGRPCNFTFGGLEFYVSKGEPAKLGCYEGASAFNRSNQTVLDYGQSQSLGAITCASESSGVTCTDTATGHFFRVSRESFDLR